ncbi:MAG: hypothetical protein AB7G25_00550 [Sphingomonadaceae bacterium]
MKIASTLSITTTLEELGHRLRQHRIGLSLSQTDLVQVSGIPLRTIERLESGASVGMDKFIQVLRGLDLFENLDQLIPETSVRPIQQLDAKHSSRQRVSTKRTHAPPPKGGWVWGDKK